MSLTRFATQTGISRAMKMLAARNRWCVTGTPNTLGSQDILSQMNFIGVNVNMISSTRALIHRRFSFGSKPLFEACASLLMRHTKEQERHGEPLLKLGDI